MLASHVLVTSTNPTSLVFFLGLVRVRFSHSTFFLSLSLSKPSALPCSICQVPFKHSSYPILGLDSFWMGTHLYLRVLHAWVEIWTLLRGRWPLSNLGQPNSGRSVPVLVSVKASPRTTINTSVDKTVK